MVNEPERLEPTGATTLYELAAHRGIPESILDSIKQMDGYLFVGLDNRNVVVSGKLKFSRKTIATISVVLGLILLKAGYLAQQLVKFRF